MEICRYFVESIKFHPVPQINHSGKDSRVRFTFLCSSWLFLSKFWSKKKKFVKEKVEPCVRKMTLIAWGLRFFRGRKERE